MIAAHARIELQRDVHGLEALAEAVDQLRQIEAVRRTRERAAKAAIRVFEDVDDAGEAVLRQQRAIQSALRGASRMHALDHRAELRRHQSRRLRAADAERVHRLRRIETQRGRRARRRRKHADGRARMPALSDVLRSHAQADARADFVAGHARAQKLAAAHARIGGQRLGDREDRRQRDRADMQHARAMHVVELEALDHRAVDERRVRRRELHRHAPHAAALGRIDFRERVRQNPAPLEARAEQRAAERIENQQLDARAHLVRNRFVRQSGHEGRDAAGIGVCSDVVVLVHRVTGAMAR